MFIRNKWYVASWCKDVTRELSSRKIMNDMIVLYRLEDGTAVALRDSCPHRNVPLSEGNLIGDSLQCCYHGLEFNAKGECTRSPGMDEIPAWAKVQAYPLVERNDWVYIWMGDPELADESMIPDVYDSMLDPDWHCVKGTIDVKGGYRLIVDNLLDLSHLAYVHSSTTGNVEVADQAGVETEVNGEHVRVTRSMTDVVPAPAYKHYGEYTENVDRWQVTNCYAPSYILINNGSYAVSDRPEQPVDTATERGHWGFQVYHAITPVTEDQTMDFWCVAIERSMLKPAAFDVWRDQMINVLREDHVVYEAQQVWIDTRPECENDVKPEGALPSDKALMAARLIQRRLYNAEQKNLVQEAGGS
ncbi:Rieske 2Fe-2S domain-containing protein [Amphritea sp. HPY]|uniref:Rieske 2Fe-2S domain-containing protein n=1 Tax=Amphritea sp. HPY TaxID=3421652 RepID=UPI003D7CBD8A